MERRQSPVAVMSSCDFALVCVAHGDVDILQVCIVEVLLLDWQNDGDITEDQFVEHLDEIRVGKDEIIAPVCYRCWLFFFW